VQGCVKDYVNGDWDGDSKNDQTGPTPLTQYQAEKQQEEKCDGDEADSFHSENIPAGEHGDCRDTL
jgi:hypothetical protein